MSLIDRRWPNSMIRVEDLRRLLQWANGADSLDVSDREIEEGHHRTAWVENLIQAAYELGSADASTSFGHKIQSDYDSLWARLDES